MRTPRLSDHEIVILVAAHLDHLHLLLCITRPSLELVGHAQASFSALLDAFHPDRKGPRPCPESTR